MYELKPLSKEAVPRALEKAERYRLLNEPAEAESICEDILRIDPDNQRTLVTLLLARTDQFAGMRGDVGRAREVLPRLRDAYERAYYAGIVFERRAKAHVEHGGPGSGFAAYDGFVQAMEWYEKAEAMRPPGNDDALLRWNACARLLMAHPHLQPGPEDHAEQPLE
jgi:tetratricopeptide (TPR) repeat protein